MTVAEVRERVDAVRKDANDADDESAHGREDELHRDVLRHIAATAPPEQAELAAAALGTTTIKFARWCA